VQQPAPKPAPVKKPAPVVKPAPAPAPQPRQTPKEVLEDAAADILKKQIDKLR
jgi:hypothetical protein